MLSNPRIVSSILLGFLLASCFLLAPQARGDVLLDTFNGDLELTFVAAADPIFGNGM